METKFTKGNWVIESTKMKGTEIVVQTVVKTDLPIDELKSHIICDIYGYMTEEGKSNAKLIAAAPELLEVLIELQESTYYWSEYDVPIGIVDRINNAIKKATEI